MSNNSEPFVILDKYDRIPIGTSDAIATISAGYKEGNTPRVSRNHIIHLHDDPKEPRAEGLRAALEKNSNKGLTIAFPFRHPAQFIKSRYAAYTASSLLYSGDTQRFQLFSKTGVRTVLAGTPEYEQLRSADATKVNHSIYFVLAEWQDDGQVALVFPDSFGVYRLRTTSHHTVQNLLAALDNIKQISGGHFAGVPFDLRLVNREGVDGSGSKRQFPVFTFAMKPRGGEFRLTSGTFRRALESGNKAASDLQLPPPREDSAQEDAAFAFIDDVGNFIAAEPLEMPEEVLGGVNVLGQVTGLAGSPGGDHLGGGVEEEVEDATFVEALTEEQLRNLEHNKDPKAQKRHWFATVKDSHLDDDEARAEFLARHVDGLSSLSDVISLLRPEQFDVLLVAAQDEITERTKEDVAQSRLASAGGWHPSVTPEDARELVSLVRHLGLSRLEVFPFISMLIGRFVSERAEVESADIRGVLAATGSRDGERQWSYSQSKSSKLLTKFQAWQFSDQAVQGLL